MRMSDARFNGAQFRALRQAAGVRTADLARAVDCHERHVAQWERGTRHISRGLARRLARGLTELSGDIHTIDEFSTTTKAAA